MTDATIDIAYPGGTKSFPVGTPRDVIQRTMQQLAPPPDGPKTIDVHYPGGMKSFPVGTPPDVIQTTMQRLTRPSLGRQMLQNVGDEAAGLVRGAGSIGSTLLMPVDMAMDAVSPRGNLSSLVTGKPALTRNQQRRADMDAALQSLGANPDSGFFGAGKMAGEVAGTAGVGAGLGAGLKAVPFIAKNAAPVISAIETGGMNAAGRTGLTGAAARVTGGAIAGGAQGAAIDPAEAAKAAAYGTVIPGVASTVGGAVKLAAKGLTRTPEAQRLLDQGISLTPGQLARRGGVNALEQAATKIPFLGPIVENARGLALPSWQRAVMQAVVPKGSGVKIAPGTSAEMLNQAYDAFKPEYAALRGAQVRPTITVPVSPEGRAVTHIADNPMVNPGPATRDMSLAEAFRDATKNPDIQADDATRASAAEWLKNKLTRLQIDDSGTRLDSGSPRFPTANPQVSSSDLLDLRSALREQIRNLRSGNPTQSAKDSAQMMKTAEDAITTSLEQNLPKQAALSLRALDRKYADYKVVEAAVAAAKDNPNGMGIHNLSTAVANSIKRSAAGTGGYARNQFAKGAAGSELRRFAQDANATILGTQPMTGAIVPAAATLMGVLGGPAAAGIGLKSLVGPAAILGHVALAGTETGRRIAAGSTAPQKTLAQLLERPGAMALKSTLNDLAQGAQRAMPIVYRR